MILDFIRFEATDGVGLQGWLNDQSGDTAVIHVHGMSGNGYENPFLDTLHEVYAKHGISFFAINTRGHGIASSFWQNKGDSAESTKLGGSCYEIFEESVHDIAGAIAYVKTLGKTRFILQGHSLGCSKVMHFVLSQDTSDIERIVLLAPTDMTGWAQSHPRHAEYLAKAKELLSKNQGQELVGAQCWIDKTPISAQTYPTICEPGSSADMYGDRPGGALLGKIQLPALCIYGDEDISILRIDGTADAWLQRATRLKNANTKIAIIKGAGHGFHNFENELAKAIADVIHK